MKLRKQKEKKKQEGITRETREQEVIKDTEG